MPLLTISNRKLLRKQLTTKTINYFAKKTQLQRSERASNTKLYLAN